MRQACVCALALLWISSVIVAAQDTAALAVTVVDPRNALVPGVRLLLIDTARGSIRQSQTNEAGYALFSELRAGDYSIEAGKEGFENLLVEQITLTARSRQSLRLELRLSATQVTPVTVTSTAATINTDGSPGVSVEKKFFQDLPVNGRNVESLIAMTSGIVVNSDLLTQFATNGLPSDDNYYTLDGVNLVSARNPSTEFISAEVMDEMRIQTAAFPPESGRSPGAQISIISRSGSNAFHGGMYYYFRHEDLGANDWFVNSAGFSRARLRENRPGGTISGPLVRDRMFFFASYEALRLATPSSIVATVPDLATRQSAPRALQPFLNAFPLPNGSQLSNGAAQFRDVVSNPSEADMATLRLDHSLNSRMTLFGRYSFVPSTGEARGGGLALSSPNMLIRRDSRSHTFTAGWTTSINASLTNDLRLNYSLTKSSSISRMDDFGGAIPLTDSVLPAGVGSTGEMNLTVLGMGSYSSGARLRNDQSQIHIVDSLTKVLGGHTYKFGAEYRRIMPTIGRPAYHQSATFSSLSELLSGVATNAQVSSNLATVYPLQTNFSFYGQDTWRASDRATLTWGLRWDVNPAPGVRQGPPPFALSSSTVAGVTQNEPPFSRRSSVAPRLGLAYQIDTTQGRELIFRAGVGLFHDIGYPLSALPFDGSPYASIRILPLAAFPLTATNAAPPALPPDRPFGLVTSADSTLKSPGVLQWNTTIERHFGHAQVLSLGYIGTKGRNLFRTETTPAFSDVYNVLRLVTNDAESSYHGLQIQFRRRMSSRLQMQIGYTYSHSIDTSSSDADFGGQFATLFNDGQRGSSDFDLRHTLNFSGSYRLPAPRHRILRTAFGGWQANWIATMRTGLPFDVLEVSGDNSDEDHDEDDDDSPNGLFALVRPDYNGLPVWIDDPNAPGGRRLNSAAFALPDGYEQGNLGRNALRGFAASQLDLSLGRQIPLTEKFQLGVAAQAYNVFNQANFSNLSPLEGANLASLNFGVATRMLNQGTFGGVSSLYRSGGARTLEITLRLQF